MSYTLAKEHLTDGAVMGLLAARFSAIFAFTSRPRPLTGLAKVIDGDTIVVADELVRLHGIDAPELDQTFWWRGRCISCGTMAMAALEALTAGLSVRCQVVERDRHRRLVAKCFTPDGVDICRRMVSAGWALAYRRYSTDYVDAENEARKAGRGMWRGKFVKPWEWRIISARAEASKGVEPKNGSYRGPWQRS